VPAGYRELSRICSALIGKRVRVIPVSAVSGMLLGEPEASLGHAASLADARGEQRFAGDQANLLGRIALPVR